MSITRAPLSAAVMALCLNAHAQQPFLTYADAPSWSVGVALMGIPYGTDAINYIDTLTVCGEQYAVTSDMAFGITGYIRNEGQRTLFRTNTDCSEAERVMYDFSASVGDTLDIGVSGGDSPLFNGTCKFVVIIVDTVGLEGIDRKRFTLRYQTFPELTDPFYMQMEWLEGIGSTTHPFFPLVCIRDACELEWGLRCTDSSSVAVFRSGPGITCQENIGIDESVGRTERTFRITTAPGALHVETPEQFKSGRLTVFDATGRLLSQMPISAEQRSLPMLPFTTGVLLATLTDNGGRQWTTRWLSMP